MSQDMRKNIDKKTKGKTPSLVPFSNEYIKKVLLGTAIIAGGVGLAGSPNQVYAASSNQVPAIVETVKKEATSVPQVQEGQAQAGVQAPKTTQEAPSKDGEDLEAPKEEIQADPAQKTGFGSQALNHPAQATAVSNVGNEAYNSGLEISEGKQPAAQKAGAEASTEPNYSEEEKNIKDYSDSERYKETDLKPGSTIVGNVNTDEGKEKDGFKFKTLNPSASSPDKKAYGYEITIDKKTGQRTYTKIVVSDSGLIPVNTGDKPMMGEGEKLTPDSPEVTYKPDEDGNISGKKQKLYNYEASEETLKHINSKDNDTTVIGMKDNYTKDNPDKKYFGKSFFITYKVNPWPNENDNLQLMKLNGEYNEKVFVQGQDLDTGIKVDNVDENAKERLVGQVYHPVTGKIVPGAKAYIANDGKIHIQMPDGAINKDGSINKESIFYKDPTFKGIQSLDVKFFARPRTADEFKAIAQAPEDELDRGTYVETGAGTATINHKGKDVVIDKQGIDRYDHYNLIGSLNLQLDDTKYYDQDFAHKDKEKETTTEVKDDELTNILPGKDFTVEMFEPSKPAPNQKTGKEMNKFLANGEAVGEINTSSLDEKNKALAEKEKVSYETFIKDDKYKNKRWEIKKDKNDIAKFTIKAPENAKSGESVSLNVKYTYTNGSTDRKVFYFVVKDSDYNKPEYKTQVNFPAIEQKSPATIPEDDKKEKPKSYSLPDEDEEGNPIQTNEDGKKIFNDDKGNKWAVSIDETSGEVTAKPVDQANFNGGEKLTVPVISHYTDPNDEKKDVTEKANAEFVIKERFNKTPRYNAKAGKSGDELSSELIIDKNDTYNREPSKFTLASDTFTDDKGNTWNVTIDENTGQVTATVPNAEEGKTIDGALLNVPVIAHYYEMQNGKPVASGTKEVEVQFVAYGTNGKVEKTEEIPFETKVEKDPKLKKGEIKVITEGKKGSKKVTYTIEDSKIDDTKTKEEVIEKAEDRVIHVGEGVNDGTHKIEEKVEVGFETEIQFDDSLAPGETKEIQKGEAGEKKRDITLTIEDGNVTKTEEGEFTETKAPKKRIIKVGRNTEGKVEHKEELPFKYKVEEVDTLKKGEYKIVKPGKVGTKTTTWTIKNSKVEGEPTVTEDPAEDALIQVGKGTNDGTHEVTEKKAIDYKTVIEYDENLDAGQQEVIKEGNPGEQERTNTLVIKDGQVTETKEGKFKTTKEATDRVVKIGTKPVTKVVEKPFNTEYVYDENLESGKTEEVTPGKNGKVTITTTYDKDQKKVVTSETEEAGQNRVVKIGGKTNGTEKVKEEIPFEVEVRKDPSLKKGEWKYATDDEGNELKGEKGEQEKTLTIVNSKVTETSEPTVTKEAKKAVVLVGEGTNDGTHEIVEKKELPFETRVEYDENLEAGKEVVTEGSLGEQERTNTLVIKDGKVVETKAGEFKTTKEAKDRVIKIGVKPIVTEVEKGYDTVYEYDENLEAGKMEEKTPGVKGKTTVTISYDKGQKKLVKKEETKDPTNRVIRVGIKPIVKEEPIPFNTEFNHNPDLEAGTKRKIKDGTPGEYKITTTFNKKTGMLETKVERMKEPTNEVWEYGSKTEGTVDVKSNIPFEVEIIEDDTMDAGTHEIVQKGQAGEKITTIVIKNSQEESRSEEITKQPVKEIIKVGTKPAKCPIPGEEPGGNTPGGNTPGGNTPGGNTPGGNTPGGNTPGGNIPGGNTSGGNTPGGNTPGGNTPGGNTPGGNTPGGNTPGSNTPGGNTPGGNTPGENTSDGNRPGGDKANTPNQLGESPENSRPYQEAQDQNQKPATSSEEEEMQRTGPKQRLSNRDDSRAPQTFDPGVGSYLGLGGLASAMLAFLAGKKRKEEDE